MSAGRASAPRALLLVAGIVAAVGAAPAGGGPHGDSGAAAAVVEAALEAHGGRAAIEGFRTFVNRSDVRHGLPGTPLQVTLYFQKPGRFRLEQQMDGALQVIVFDGRRCWIQRAGEVIESPELVPAIQGGLTRGLDMITRYDRPGVELVDLGSRTTVDGVPAHAVRWTERGEETVLSFDGKSRLWIQSEYALATPNGRARYVYRYGDHRLVGGILSPHHTTCFIEGQIAYEYVAVDYRYDVPLHPALFEQPTGR